MSRIVLVEDSLASRFAPMSLLRPVFELRCGHFSVRERIQHLAPSSRIEVTMRKILAEVYAEEHANITIHPSSVPLDPDTLVINGRWLCDESAWQALQQLPPGTVARQQDEWVAVRGSEGQSCSRSTLESWLTSLPTMEFPGGMVLSYPWELIEQNSQQIIADFQLRNRLSGVVPDHPQIAVLGNPDQISIHETADIDPFVVLDARHGPIWIDAHVKLQAFTRLEGPCFVGERSQLFRANVREGCSIGPVCRVGGEIEESIIHGHANKYHDGFLGHAYVCPWVNLGANTINSDLKNDYSTVKVMVDGQMLDSGSTKVGCFIGDHTKTALASLFNTGSSVGIMSLVLPGGELLPKVIPSFTRVWHGQLEEYPQGIDAAVAAARVAMGRRKLMLSPAAEKLLRAAFEQTQSERDRSLARLQ